MSQVLMSSMYLFMRSIRMVQFSRWSMPLQFIMKQINSLFSQFNGSDDYPLVSKLQRSSILQNNLVIQMSDIIYLIECFQGYGPEQDGTYLSGIDYIKQFFAYLSSNPILPLPCLKICVSLHLVLYEFQVGEILAEQILNSPQSLNQLKSNEDIPIGDYKMYLLKLAQSLKIFYAAKVGQYPPMEQEEVDVRHFTDKRLKCMKSLKPLKKSKGFGENRTTLHEYQQEQLEKQFQTNAGYINTNQKTLILFKLQNIMQNAIQLLSQFLLLIPKMKNGTDSILIEISCVLWNDIMVCYKFCGSETNKLVDNLRSLSYQQVLTIQQLYLSITEKTKDIQEIYGKRKVFDVQNILRKPYWQEASKMVKGAMEELLIDLRFEKGIEQGKSQRVATTVEKEISRKDREGYKHPFTYRHGQNVMTQPQPDSPSGEGSPPETKRKQFMKQAFGAIFEDDVKQKQKTISKDNSTQPSNKGK